MTFIPAMTIMFFSTCHSGPGIIPGVECFVLHVLQSSGMRGCADAAADSAEKQSGRPIAPSNMHYFSAEGRERPFNAAWLLPGAAFELIFPVFLI